MNAVSLDTLILGILVRKGRPLRLSEILEAIKFPGLSKTTVYRHLQRLVEKGLVSRKSEEYFPISDSKIAITSADLSRISELKPLHHETGKGLRITIYGSQDLSNPVFKESLNSNMKEVMGKILSSIDPGLQEIFNNASLTEETVKKLIGMKLVLVATFDGTDFSVLTPEEETKKRREVITLLSRTDGIAIDELAEQLNLNILEAIQIVDPLLKSNFAKMDESGKIKLTVEVKPIE